jgi:hypothetical protein
MENQGQIRDNLDVLPPWAIDPEVKVFLESEGIELVIFQDEKYRGGFCNKPLIVLRGISPPKQYYLYVDGGSDESVL